MMASRDRYIHPEGTPTLLIVGGVCAVLIAGLWLAFAMPGLWTGIVLSLPLMLFFLQFFRNPKRKWVHNPAMVISPADGKVVVIEKVFEPEFLKTDCMQISIFMSPTDVHINRIPISGRLIYHRYHPGKYLVAWHPKSSELNERNTSVIEDAQGHRLLLRQIAGAVARRIVFFHPEGAMLKQTGQIGFIKFGSRADLFLPLDADIKVQIGDVVRGGVSVISSWPSASQ